MDKQTLAFSEWCLDSAKERLRDHDPHRLSEEVVICRKPNDTPKFRVQGSRSTSFGGFGFLYILINLD